MEYPYIIKNLKNWPISRFYSNRQRVVRKLTEHAIQRIKSEHPDNIGSILSEVIYAEKLRTKANPLKVDPPKEYAYWKRLESILSGGVVQDKEAVGVHEELLQKIVKRYAEEIVGDFNIKTFGFARKVLTHLFKLIYNPFYTKGQAIFWGNRSDLLKKFDVVGPLDHIRHLFDKGTMMILPTHFSNLDSILVGYVIEMLTGLPAFSYGAGLNLYDYEVMAYYMSRLGAYKIDRRKKNPVYASTLREFSTISIEEGLNSIFFSGGTRSRSGALESTLKLGLMNTLIDSQNEFYMYGKNKKLIIVPLVISYHSILEASSLIDQHLRRTGKSSYLTSRNKKKSSLGKLRFLYRLFKYGSGTTLSFGHPIDIFGNRLDSEGNSIKNEKVIDIRGYFEIDGKVTKDIQRNRVFSRHLANALTQSYRKENVVLTSHLVAFCAFEIFKKKYPNLDLFSLLTLPMEYFIVALEDFYNVIERIQDVLITKSQEGVLKLSETVESSISKFIVSDGIRHLEAYHNPAPLGMKKGLLLCNDLKILYYYHNRLDGYDMDQYITVSGRSRIKIATSLY